LTRYTSPSAINAKIVRAAQFAMLAFCHYDGELDGVLGPAMRKALERIKGRKVTGAITPETLNALRNTAQ
jgi:hypothetical protein